MKMTIRYTLLSAALGLFSHTAFAEVDCAKLAQSVKQAIAADAASTLQVVEKEIAANPGCACEVVKAAIEGSNADAKLVAAIVETASTAAPQHLRLISQCAVAVAPDALSEVQAVMAKIDPSSGEAAPMKSDSKDAKDEKGPGTQPPPAANPLDFPGSMFGAPIPLIRTYTPIIIFPPPVSAVVAP
jgi:hypothetical protein